jgi:hypothetical protein
MKQAIRTILIVWVVYVAMSFILGDYNALKWTQDQRLAMVMISMIVYGITYYIEQEQNIYK